MDQKQNLVKLSQDQIDELEYFLLNTDMDLELGLSNLNLTSSQLEPSSFDDLYASIFKCDWCGFWYDATEDCGMNSCYSCSALRDEEFDEDDFIDNEDNALDDGDDL